MNSTIITSKLNIELLKTRNESLAYKLWRLCHMEICVLNNQDIQHLRTLELINDQLKIHSAVIQVMQDYFIRQDFRNSW